MPSDDQARRQRPRPSDDPSDDELVRQTRSGIPEAFGTLWDRYHAAVYGYCYRHLGDREAAQDTTAETFKKALSALATYRPGSFRGWLFSIARNIVVDHRRGQRLVLDLEAAAAVADRGRGPDDLAVTAAEISRIVELLGCLTQDQRDAVTLRLEGLSPAEIAHAMGKSRAAADMAFHRAIVRLRELMTDADDLRPKGRSGA